MEKYAIKEYLNFNEVPSIPMSGVLPCFCDDYIKNEGLLKYKELFGESKTPVC